MATEKKMSKGKSYYLIFVQTYFDFDEIMIVINKKNNNFLVLLLNKSPCNEYSGGKGTKIIAHLDITMRLTFTNR